MEDPSIPDPACPPGAVEYKTLTHELDALKLKTAPQVPNDLVTNGQCGRFGQLGGGRWDSWRGERYGDSQVV